MWDEARLNPLMEKKFSELEEGVDYIDLSKHEYDDPNLDSDDYDARGPRWVVCAQIEEFWSYHLGRWDKTLTKADPVDVKVNGNRI